MYHDRYHHVVPRAWIPLPLPLHLSLSSITFGRSSGLHPVSVSRCYGYVLIGHPTSARLCEGVYKRTSLNSPAVSCMFFRLIWMFFKTGGKWTYRSSFVGCRFQVLFNITRCILLQLPSSFFSMRLVTIHVVHPDNSMPRLLLGKMCFFYRIVLTDSWPCLCKLRIDVIFCRWYAASEVSEFVHYFEGATC